MGNYMFRCGLVITDQGQEFACLEKVFDKKHSIRCQTLRSNALHLEFLKLFFFSKKNQGLIQIFLGSKEEYQH